ncbi:hypothetical protein [Acidianus manzaensis]|uniref:Uncharacterized protein n=1 Tax=Acidianus manzaensis TaxID=282676 RepID=A0A1W6K2U4_9CREN|nr:hypothetical protein [Acidianus manzaensis]ARM76871.1 hypothetical protein B6F84_13135 [Acidianus manzaensis]
MFKSLLAGFFAGLIDVIFYLNDLNIFSVLSFHILKVYSIPLGIILHIIASTIIFFVAVFLIEKSGIKMNGLFSVIILGLLTGSAVLALFSLPVHLLIFPIKITLIYVLAHVFYGLFGYLIYWSLRKI